jgi:hypothetical protein
MIVLDVNINNMKNMHTLHSAGGKEWKLNTSNYNMTDGSRNVTVN